MLTGKGGRGDWGERRARRRRFSFRERAVDRAFAAGRSVVRFSGVPKEYAYDGIDSPAIITDAICPAVAVPPKCSAEPSSRGSFND
jgi:hypothetical protein